MNEVIADSRELLKYIFNKLCEVHYHALTNFLLARFCSWSDFTDSAQFGSDEHLQTEIRRPPY